MEDKKFYPVTMFGVRFEDKDGWILAEWPTSYKEVIQELEQRDMRILEVREITQGLCCTRDENGNPKVDDSLLPIMAFNHGWAFDSVHECWRAPSELIPESPNRPKAAKDFSISVGKINAGWALMFKVDEQEHTIQCSNASDPLHDLIGWMEEIYSNRSARVMIDEEGMYTSLTAYDRCFGHVRLTIHAYYHDVDKPIDAYVSKYSLIKSLYEAILFIPKDEKSFYDKRACPEKNAEEICPDLRSQTLDKYLHEMRNAQPVFTVMADFGSGPWGWFTENGSQYPPIGGNVADATGADFDELGFEMDTQLQNDFNTWVTSFENEYSDKAFDWDAFHIKGLDLTQKFRKILPSNIKLIYSKPVEDPGHDESTFTEFFPE
ncbi:hypothetical protein [Desulfovibrio inopinatus]|uniref:hypothetical protein n=1 Tax=Desulfovibrio inopinatus TaxID=102109 RepID=UPI00040FE3B8|nr:hypothetical protein [Desulfovibrio inopinatus]